MKQDQQNVLNQLRTAMSRAYPHIHAPITSDITTYQNMLILRGYLDGLIDALRANGEKCEELGSITRRMRAGLDLCGRLLLCRNWSMELADALAIKDEDKLAFMRVRKLDPINCERRPPYNRPELEEEEDKEYFARLDSAMTDVDGLIDALTGKWMAHFDPRYEKPVKPDYAALGNKP